MAWVAVRNADLATPITGMPNSACACAPRAWPSVRVEIGVAVDHQQAQPADAAHYRTHRRQFPQVELTWPVWQHLGHHREAFGQHVREGGIGGYHGRCPGTTGTQVMHIHGREHAEARTPADSHATRMPVPRAGVEWPGQTPAWRPAAARGMLGLVVRNERRAGAC